MLRDITIWYKVSVAKRRPGSPCSISVSTFTNTVDDASVVVVADDRPSDYVDSQRKLHWLVDDEGTV